MLFGSGRRMFLRKINALRMKTPYLLVVASSAALAQFGPPPIAPSNGPPPVVQEGPRLSFNGSVPTGQATATPLDLTLRDAIQRGLRYNLGILTSRDVAEVASVERRRTLSTLLPNFYAAAVQTSSQVDLAAFGFSSPGFPTVVGPFGTQNVRAYAQQTVYDRPSLPNLKSATETQKAQALSAEDARNLVVEAVSNAYLTVITDSDSAAAIQAEIATAQALYDRAADQKNAGTVAGIDVLRAQLELRTEQQRLVAQNSQIGKDKLVLARAVGLPTGQRFNVVDTFPFT